MIGTWILFNEKRREVFLTYLFTQKVHVKGCTTALNLARKPLQHNMMLAWMMESSHFLENVD